jgi:hypothetical protein
VNKSTYLDLNNVTHKSKYDELMKICNTIAGRAGKYIHRWHTGLNEGIHRMYKVGAEKTLDYMKTYEGRIDGEALRYNEGNYNSMEQVTQELGVTLSEGGKKILYNSEQNRQQQQQLRMSNKGRQSTVNQRLKVRHIHTQAGRKQSDTFYPNSVQEKKRRLKQDTTENTNEPPQKRKKKDQGYCVCNGHCDNNRCSCKKAGRYCNINCHKKSTQCHNHQ